MMSFLRRWVLHNFWLKVLSLVLSTGLWLAIAPDQEPAEVAVRVPIEFQHVPSGLEISSVTIPDAQIRVRGPERLIRELRSTDIHAELELGDAKPGERTFDLTSQQIRHQRDLTVVQVVPGQVHLSFDTRLTREVEIHARVTGNFAAGDRSAKCWWIQRKSRSRGRSITWNWWMRLRPIRWTLLEQKPRRLL